MLRPVVLVGDLAVAQPAGQVRNLASVARWKTLLCFDEVEPEHLNLAVPEGDA